MKKLTVITNAILLTFIFAIVSCQPSSSKKLQDAKADVAEADKNLEQAEVDYLADMATYRKEVDTKITANEQSIKDFKARIAESKEQAKEDYDEEIIKLEEKNTDMKRKLDEYKQKGKDQWDSFKKEFNHDMDELGNALRDLTVNNKK
jgi:hypothetical protein